MSHNIHGWGNNPKSGEPGGFMPVWMSDSSNPRDESCPSFVKSLCCPFFKFNSVVFYVSCIDIIAYVITLCFGVKLSPTELLAPTYETLDWAGMKNPLKIQHGEVWRWVTFGLYHANWVHIAINLFSQVIIGSMLEKEIGHLKTAFLYVFSSIGGGIFSCLVSDASGVGASVAIFGMLSAYIGYWLINWNYLNRMYGIQNNLCNLMFLIFIVLMNVSYGFSNPIIDNYGHLGGLICGFFLIFIVFQPNNNEDSWGCSYKIWRCVSIAMVMFLYIGQWILFYTVRKI